MIKIPKKNFSFERGKMPPMDCIAAADFKATTKNYSYIPLKSLEPQESWASYFRKLKRRRSAKHPLHQSRLPEAHFS